METIDDLTTIAVSDDGIGIEQSHLSRLFESEPLKLGFELQIFLLKVVLLD